MTLQSKKGNKQHKETGTANNKKEAEYKTWSKHFKMYQTFQKWARPYMVFWNAFFGISVTCEQNRAELNWLQDIFILTIEVSKRWKYSTLNIFWEYDYHKLISEVFLSNNL